MTESRSHWPTVLILAALSGVAELLVFRFFSMITVEVAIGSTVAVFLGQIYWLGMDEGRDLLARRGWRAVMAVVLGAAFASAASSLWLVWASNGFALLELGLIILALAGLIGLVAGTGATMTYALLRAACNRAGMMAKDSLYF